MIIGTLMALETCLILGQVSHNLLYSKKNLLTDICGPGGRLTRKQLTSRPDHLWPELWKSMGKHANLKEKQKWSEEKFHLENARKLRGIYFIDPEDTEFKETIKNARKKLEVSVAPAMPCKIAKNCGNGGPKSWSSMEDRVVLLERNLYGHPLAGLLWERQFENILLKHGWEKIPNWECLFVHREKGLFLSVYVDDIKLAGKKQNLDPMWKVLNKEVDLGEPTSFLDHENLGCTQRKCEISKDIVGNYRTMFESRISAGGLEKLPFPQHLRISSWSYDMAGHAKKCVERYCELANKTTQQLYKVSTPCIDDHHFREEETKSVGELSNTCSQIVLKCLYLARIGRPDR